MRPRLNCETLETSRSEDAVDCAAAWSAASRNQRTASASSLRTPSPLAYLTSLRTEIELRSGVTLVGGQPEPAHRFGLVLEDAFAQGVHDPEIELRFGGSLLGVNEEPSYRCGIVAAFIRRRGFVKCLRRRDRYAEQHSQQRQGDNAAPNQPVFNACL